MAYFLLGILTVIAGRGVQNAYWFTTMIVAYAGCLELCQIFDPGRHAAVGDFMASSAGAIAGITLAAFAARALRRKGLLASKVDLD